MARFAVATRFQLVALGLAQPLGSSPIPSLAGSLFYLNGIGFSGKNGVSKGLANSQWLNFGPRIGFAYDLAGNGKTVVRAGFGVMYERIQGNDMYDGAQNPPFGYALGTSNVLLSDPHVHGVEELLRFPSCRLE
jgi:hypothetical protein